MGGKKRKTKVHAPAVRQQKIVVRKEQEDPTEAMDMLESLKEGLDTNKLFEQLFSQFLGKQGAVEITKEQLLAGQAEIDEITENVAKGIEEVDKICQMIENDNFASLGEDGPNPTEDLLKGIEITPQIESKLKQKSKEYQTLLQREDLITQKIENLRKLVAEFPEDSACYGLGDLLCYTSEEKLKSNTNFKKYLILQDQP